MSPVCSQPSSSMVSAVASSLPRYPAITLGPLNHSSPVSLRPSAGGSISSPVSGSMSLDAALDTVQPTELSGATVPMFRWPPSNGVMWLTGLSSLIP